MAFGILLITLFQEELSNDRFAGMIAGAGAGLLTCGVIFLIRDRIISKEKKMLEEIERNDERNQMILSHSFVVAGITSAIAFALMAFLFAALRFFTCASIVICGLYIELLTLVIARKYYEKKF